MATLSLTNANPYVQRAIALANARGANLPTTKIAGTTWDVVLGAALAVLEAGEKTVAEELEGLSDKIDDLIEAVQGLEVVEPTPEPEPVPEPEPDPQPEPEPVVQESADGAETAPYGAALIVKGQDYRIDTAGQVVIGGVISQDSANVKRLRRVGDAVLQFADWGDGSGWFTVPADGSKGERAEDPTAPAPEPQPEPGPTPDPVPEPQPTVERPLYTRPIVTVGDAYASAPGVYFVPVMLEAPVPQTLAWRFSIANGSDGSWDKYESKQIDLVVFPGETCKHIPVTVTKAMAPGVYFEVVLEGYPGDPPQYLGDPIVKHRGRVGNVAGYPVTPPPQTLKAMTFPATPTVVFEEKFGADFLANDRGLRPDGTPCWVNRLGHGRVQEGNREIGYYGDQDENPGCVPYGRDAKGFFVQAQQQPNGILKNGQKLLKSWDGQPFLWSAGMITTESNFDEIRKGDYVEVNAALPTAHGSWPAIWLVDREFWNWPSKEVDLMEGFFSHGYSRDRVGSTVHAIDPRAGYIKFGILGAALRACDPNYDPTKFNRYGCHLGDDLTFTLNGKVYQRQPNYNPNAVMKLLLNVAIEGNSPIASQFPAKMYLDYARVSR